MHIAIITAGGAGMFCGSCMHDNTWARALQQAGAEVTLIPTYTPIRVDEEDVSQKKIFFGGINVYLEHRFRFWQKFPRWMIHWLDSPRLIRFATSFGISNDAKELGELTIDMLKGEKGSLHHEVDELVDYLTQQLKPDVICFSNVLLSGAVSQLRKQFDGQIYCTLQGDDVFLNDLSVEHRSAAIDLISSRNNSIDGFIAHSTFYADAMSDYFRLPLEKFHLIPLGIDLSHHDGKPQSRKKDDNFTIGFFARICPEKGLHRLIDAFLPLHEKYPNIKLRVGGYLGARDEDYFQQQITRINNWGDTFTYIGSPSTHAEKVAFYKSCDLVSVPTEYHEPKGLSLLEAMANGLPIVQPQHGAFPEMIAATDGGLLVEPNNATSLCTAIEKLLTDETLRMQLATAGHTAVHAKYSSETLAEKTLALFEQTK